MLTGYCPAYDIDYEASNCLGSIETYFLISALVRIDLLDRMGVWILDGVVWHSQLLPFVLRRESLAHTTVMIVVDLSQPWGIMESLERWAEVVRKHIQSLRIPDRELREMEERSESTINVCPFAAVYATTIQGCLRAM